MQVTRAARLLGRARAFTATAVLVLTLAVGALTTVFSLLRALVLRPLPVPAPHELVQVTTRDRLGRDGDLTWRQFKELVSRQRAFTTVIGSMAQGTVTLETDQGVTRSAITGVTGRYFDELGAIPALGRLIGTSDADMTTATASPVVVLGWSFWQRHYGGDRAVLGRTLRAEGVPLSIVGVAPPGFLGLGITVEPDVTVPLVLVPRLFDADAALLRGTSRWVATTGRLAPGVSLEAARSQVTTIWSALREAAMPAGLPDAARTAYVGLEVEVASGARGVERGLRGRYTDALYALLAIAAAMGLVAAVNLSALAFVRMDASRHDLAVRMALGASRLDLVRETLMQGVILGVAGAGGGLVLAAYASRGIADMLLVDYLVPTALDVSPDGIAIALAAAAGVGTGLLMMAGGTWAVTARGVPALGPGGGRSVGRSTRIGRVLVAMQAAVSMVLVTQASLLARNVHALTRTDAGLTRDSVLVSTPSPRVGAYRGLDAVSYYRDALARVRAVPGVTAAAFTQSAPERGALALEPVARASTPDGTHDVLAEGTGVSPGLFETLGIPIVDGRDFTLDDRDGRPRVAILSRRLARQLFGEGRAVGQRLRLPARPGSEDVEVVGVAADVALFDIRGGNRAIAYVPALQTGRQAHFKTLVVRGPPAAARAIERSLGGIGVEQLPRMQTLDAARARTLRQERLLAGLSGAFGATALLLVAAGMYGLLSYVLSLRRKEIGIRLALGADRHHLSYAIVGTGLRLTALGAATGLGVAVPVARWLRSVMVAVSPYEPVALAGAGALLLGAAALATIPPALRAARVDPLTELRRD